MSEHLVSIHREKKSSLLASQDRRDIKRPTPERPLIISVSELSSWLRCRVKHHWEYQCQLEPMGTRLPLVTGRVGHTIIHQYYAMPYAQRNWKRMNRIAKDILKKTSVKELPLEDKELLEAMTTGYALWATDPNTEYGDKAIGLRECWPEEKFELPLTLDGSIRVHGRIDNRFAPLKYKKTLGSLETKFLSSIRTDNVERIIQLSCYLWAMREKWPEFKRYQIYYQILRKQLPGPRVKADLFFREPIERSNDEIGQWVLDTRRQALDMLDGAVYPNPLDSCSWSCDFKVPCLMRGNEDDLLYTLNDSFQKRTYK